MISTSFQCDSPLFLSSLNSDVQSAGVLQHRLLQVPGNLVHGIATHVERHLARHHRLLPHELILLLLAYTHKVLLSKSVQCWNMKRSFANRYLATDLIMCEILANIVVVSSLALGLEELPEEAPPVQKKSSLHAFIWDASARQIIRDFDLLAILAVSHHRVTIDTVHIVLTIAGTGFGSGIRIDLHIVLP